MATRVEKYQSSVQAALTLAKEHDLYAIVRVQDNIGLEVSILNGKTQSKRKTQLQGMGISVFSEDGTTAFGWTDDPTVENTETLIRTLNGAVRASQMLEVQKNTAIFEVPPFQVIDLPNLKYPVEEQNLTRLEDALRGGHLGVCKLNPDLSVTSSFSQSDDQWWISRSDGTSVIYSMPISNVRHSMTMGDSKNKAMTNLKLSGVDAEFLMNPATTERELWHKVSVSYALLGKLFSAGQLPEGEYQGLLDPGIAGIYVHEAVGHPIESDNGPFSIFADKKLGTFGLGNRVAQPNIDVIDGPVEGMWGDVRYSANGVQRKTVVVIEKGILVNSISDVFSAARAGTPINGAGRAQYFNSVPIPRMSNTRIIDRDAVDADIHPPYASVEELYSLLEDLGVLSNGKQVVMPVQCGGGSVLPTEGTFMFGCNGIYRFSSEQGIELFGASNFSGNTQAALLTPMRGIGKLHLNNAGWCGKEGQSASVGCGSHAYVLIDANPGKIIYGGK
ncbi:MAG TPA: TldD/PmbA family protein [Candidatus Nanoarchaeia archaeon]|nr:TldD/PmbA family protein [Candidatus Nanoarchaeia archaeon]